MFDFNNDGYKVINILHDKVIARSNLYGNVIEYADLDFVLIVYMHKLE